MAPGQFGRYDGQLDGAGDPDHQRVGHAARVRGGHGPVDQDVGDLGVPAGGGDGQAQPGRRHHGPVGPAGAAHRTLAALSAAPVSASAVFASPVSASPLAAGSESADSGGTVRPSS